MQMAAENRMTLLEYQTLLGNTIRMNPQLQGVWVLAELSDVRVAGGHCYMELIEKDAAGQTRAKMRAMIWQSNFRMLRSRFYEATGRDIVTGLKVLVRGSATHHQLYGLSFTIADIDPNYTLGDMERLRREIIERLHREGVDNYNKSLPFPEAPQKIAVVSADGAAGYGDFMNQLGNNREGFALYPLLFPAVMQGERTAPSVMAALDRIEQALDFWDCVVIIRGGGATTDLNGFDNLELARRVATFPIPVVAGIGHERDRTVLDELACVRCKTPTASAEFLIDRLRAARDKALELVQRVAKYAADRLNGEHLRLSNLEQTLPARVKQNVLQQNLRLERLGAAMQRGIALRISREQDKATRVAARLQSAVAQTFTKASMRLDRTEALLRVLSPENTLRRGYSITRVNGHAVRHPENIPPGTLVETRLEGGSFKSKVVE